ncbi:sortilin-like isoform X2 [Antedon mediterranea]|uniref:sortilin-like isoform X2 n=1 Tax=Antedon mediterranea TaxID=105859 RepID=UPI003AF7601E
MATVYSRTWIFSLRFSMFIYIWLLLNTVSALTYQSEKQLDLIHKIKNVPVVKFDQSPIIGPGPNESQFVKVNKRSSGQRSRRTTDGSCEPVTAGEKAKLLKKQSNFTFGGDSNFNLALVWLGEDGEELLALTTMDFGIFVGPSNLWISNDFGRTFINKNNEIKNAIIRADFGINKSPDPGKIIFVGFVGEDFSKTELFITDNSGKDFVQPEILPFYIDGPLIFHPHKSDYILAHSKTDQYSLWLSTDFGKNWIKLESWVTAFRWGEKREDDYNIYIVIDNNKMKDETSLDLVLKRKLGVSNKQSFKVILPSVHTFGVQDKFLFASVQDESSKSRSLYVSTDDGDSWNKAVLPSLKADMFYSVLDSTEGMIFVHVDDAGNNGYGQLYTSDADGLIFSQSLDRHLYPNGGDVTDFYRVKSIRGVYLASQILPDQSIRTRITFNRGAEWRNVIKHSDIICKEDDESCNLQIHNKYSMSQGVPMAMGPLSNPNAVGLILVHGHLGTELHTSEPDVYISEDGGYSWNKALDGPHHYAITNYGALIVAVPQKSSTNVIKYSVDAGQCWNEYVFTSEPIAVTGLLPEPNIKSLNVSIWGYDMETRIWNAFSINFKAVLESTCNSDDFETWKPHEKNSKKGCLLGYLETFRRIKRGARCSVDINYDHQVYQTQDQCECTQDDYECAFGFKREDGQGQCKLDPQFKNKVIDICVKHEEEKEVSTGYRLIPGDKCNGGFRPKTNLLDLHENCDGTRLATENSKHGGLKVFIILLFVVMAAIGIGYVYVKRYSIDLPCFKTRNIMYRYSELSQKDELDNALDKALNLDEESHVYHDESDDDMLS